MKSSLERSRSGIENRLLSHLIRGSQGLTGYYFDEKKVKSVSEKGYTFEKAQDLINYCNDKIELFKQKYALLN